MVDGRLRIIFCVAKSIGIEVGADRDGSNKRFGVKTEKGIEVFIEVGVACDDEALRLIRRVDNPAGEVVGKSKEDATRSVLELLLVGHNLVAESRFVALEKVGHPKTRKLARLGLHSKLNW